MEVLPRYVPNTRKAIETVLWIVENMPAADVYHIAKAAYFADKFHIATYGRPITGDTYQAAPFGPLGQVVYGLLRQDPIEMIAVDTNGKLPFRMDERYQVISDRGPNLQVLSESDIEALAHGCDHVRDRKFDDIYRETHGDPAYHNASGGQLDFRDFIPDSDPDKADKAEAIEETARYAVF